MCPVYLVLMFILGVFSQFFFYVFIVFMYDFSAMFPVVVAKDVPLVLVQCQPLKHTVNSVTLMLK